MSGGQSNVPWKEAVKCLAPRWGRDEWMLIFSGDFSLAIQWQREAEQIILLCICQWIPKEAVTTIFRDPLKYISRIVGINCHTCRRLLLDIKSVEYLDKTHQWIIDTTKGGCRDNIRDILQYIYCIVGIDLIVEWEHFLDIKSVEYLEMPRRSTSDSDCVQSRIQQCSVMVKFYSGICVSTSLCISPSRRTSKLNYTRF